MYVCMWGVCVCDEDVFDMCCTLMQCALVDISIVLGMVLCKRLFIITCRSLLLMKVVCNLINMKNGYCASLYMNKA